MTEQFKLVPFEPTEEMVRAASSTYSAIGHTPDLGLLKEAIADAIAAAPAQTEPAEAVKTLQPVQLSEDVREYLQEGIENATQCEAVDVDYAFADQLNVLLNGVYAEPLDREAIRNEAIEECADKMDMEGHSGLADAIRSLKSQPAQPDYKFAYQEWIKKTEFIQERIADGSLSAKYLGWHRADVMRDLIDISVRLSDAEKTKLAAFPKMLEALKIAENFCGKHTAEDCPDDIAIPINEAYKSAIDAANGSETLKPAQPTLKDSISKGINQAISEGDGIWRSCTGCHELNEGHDTGPYSDIFKCHLGNGCHECGGIGAIWDDTDYAAMGDAMAKSMEERPAQLSGNSGELPSDCPDCNGEGERDSGGNMPWGDPAMVPCDCQPPADWSKDSSLETWFPMTAEKLKQQDEEISALKAQLATSQPSDSEKLYSALRLARDMMLANDLDIPHTMEVIEDALKLKPSDSQAEPSDTEILQDALGCILWLERRIQPGYQRFGLEHVEVMKDRIKAAMRAEKEVS